MHKSQFLGDHVRVHERKSAVAIGSNARPADDERIFKLYRPPDCDFSLVANAVGSDKIVMPFLRDEEGGALVQVDTASPSFGRLVITVKDLGLHARCRAADDALQSFRPGKSSLAGAVIN